MPFKQFDRSLLELKPLAEREHDLARDVLVYPASLYPRCPDPALPLLASGIRAARANGRAVILLLGAHVIRRGLAPLLIDLMRRGLVSHVALNGAGAIHDYEMALIGRTCENVARYASTGDFGLWRESGGINAAAAEGHRDGIGLGEAIGRKILADRCPFAETSLLAAGCRLEVPVTVHVSIGQDIVHEHPDFDGAATGATSYADFLVFAESVSALEGGVLLNVGTAVTGPEIFLKALAMARNVARRQGRVIRRFTTGVFDLVDLDAEGLRREAPKSDPRYYFRPYKTILVRAVAGGGESHYVRGDHGSTLPTLYHLILEQ